jgi:hypothetical protein
MNPKACDRGCHIQEERKEQKPNDRRAVEATSSDAIGHTTPPVDLEN